LLPTATDNIIHELETERITYELQQQKAAKLARSGEINPSELGSGPPSVTDDDGRSMASLQSESGVHASQMGIPSASIVGEGPQDGGQQAQKIRKSKLQLWNDLKISCKSWNRSSRNLTNKHSNYSRIHIDIYFGSSHSPHPDTTEFTGPEELSVKRGISCNGWNGTVNHQPGKSRRRQSGSGLWE
jgi:hypothetical protein